MAEEQLEEQVVDYLIVFGREDLVGGVGLDGVDEREDLGWVVYED